MCARTSPHLDLKPLNDGEWHVIKLTLLTGQSFAEVDNAAAAIELAGWPTVPLSDLFAITSLLHVGAPPAQQPDNELDGTGGYVGCMSSVEFGNLPPLTLGGANDRPGRQFCIWLVYLCSRAPYASNGSYKRRHRLRWFDTVLACRRVLQ